MIDVTYVPYKVINDTDLTHEAFRLFVVLLRYSDNKEMPIDSNLSYNIIKAETRIRSDQTVSRALKQLESKGYIKPRQSVGFIYVIKCAGYFKIGKTRNMGKRLRDYSTHYPLDVELVLCCPSSDMDSDETHLHRIYEAFRVKGEWFALEDWHIDTIRQFSFSTKGVPAKN